MSFEDSESGIADNISVVSNTTFRKKKLCQVRLITEVNW
jgi:hypothetical protein